MPVGTFDHGGGSPAATARGFHLSVIATVAHRKKYLLTDATATGTISRLTGMASAITMLIGVISDTHGLMRREAIAALGGSDLILHAGDVGRAEVLDELRGISPTFAVRGNVDRQVWAAALPETQRVKVGQLRFYVLHQIAELPIDPAASGYAAVVYGHSHKPSIDWRDGVLYLNPGSAGPRRFRLPVTIARVRVSGRTMDPEIVKLDVR